VRGGWRVGHRHPSFDVAVDLLDHESAATTLNLYAGLFPTHLDDIVSRLNAAARLTIATRLHHLMPKNHRPQHRPEQATASRRALKNHR
jgi:hypothetical protein